MSRTHLTEPKIGENIRKYIDAVHISQEELARQLGVTAQSVSDWISGTSVPRLKKLNAMCSIFNCEMPDLIGTECGDDIADLKGAFANNLKYYLYKNGITQTELCNDLGLPIMTVSDWINAKTYPRIEKIKALADYFGVSKPDLIEEHEYGIIDGSLKGDVPDGSRYAEIDLARRVKELRIEKDMSQEDLAAVVGISASSVGMIEQGRRFPRKETIEALARALNVTVGCLLGDSQHNGILIETQDDGADNDLIRRLVKAGKSLPEDALEHLVLSLEATIGKQSVNR